MSRFSLTACRLFSATRGPFSLLVLLLSALLCVPATARAADEEDANQTVVSFGLPEGAKLEIDGRDYPAEKKLTFKQLTPGKEYQSRVRVTLPSGLVAERRVAFTAGDALAFTWEQFTDGEGVVVSHPLLATRSATAAVSLDGKRLVLPIDNQTAALFDAESGDFLHRFQPHEGRLRGAAISPDGRRVATAGEDNLIRIFAIDNPEPVRRVEPPKHPERATASTPRRPLRPLRGLGESIGNAIGEGLAEALTEPLRNRYSHVHSVAFSPDGRQLLSGQYDGSVRLWDVETGRQVRQYCGPRSAYSNDILPAINTAAFSADGLHVTAADQRGFVRIWETSTGRETARFRADKFNARSAQFSPDGRYVLTVGDDSVARIWKAESGEHLHLLYPSKDAAIRLACFAGDGQVMTLGDDTAVRFWNAETGEETRRLPVGPSFVSKDLLIVDPSGDYLLTDGLLGHQSRRLDDGGLVNIFRAASP